MTKTFGLLTLSLLVILLSVRLKQNSEANEKDRDHLDRLLILRGKLSYQESLLRWSLQNKIWVNDFAVDSIYHAHNPDQYVSSNDYHR